MSPSLIMIVVGVVIGQGFSPVPLPGAGQTPRSLGSEPQKRRDALSIIAAPVRRSF
jgi:hypothetical protein